MSLMIFSFDLYYNSHIASYFSPYYMPFYSEFWCLYYWQNNKYKSYFRWLVSMQTEWTAIHYNLDIRILSSVSMQAILLLSFNLLRFRTYLRYRKNKQAKQIRNHTTHRIANKLHLQKEIKIYNPLESTVPFLLEILVLPNPLFYFI